MYLRFPANIVGCPLHRNREHARQIQIVTPEFYASVWDEDITKKALAIAGFWMGVGNFIMYRLVNFRI